MGTGTPGLGRAISSAVVVVVALLAATPCWASEGTLRLHVDWDALGDSLARLQESGREARARVVSESSSKWIDGKPLLVSLVARNWEGASRLAGGPMPATDAVHVSRLSRLLVGRVGWTGGPIVPFVHLGVGQWRDPDPHVLAAPLEYAGQVGAGAELAAIASGYALAVEYDWTRVYADTRDLHGAHLAHARVGRSVRGVARLVRLHPLTLQSSARRNAATMRRMDDARSARGVTREAVRVCYAAPHRDVSTTARGRC